MTKTIEDIKKELGLENKEFEDMTDRSLCILYESSDEYIDELMEEIVERARYVAICREINPEDIWKFADGYDSVDDVWNDLDRFDYDVNTFINDCISLIEG